MGLLRKLAMTLGLFATASMPVQTLAQQAATSDDAAAFGARENILQVSLSPDGSKVAFLTPGAGQGVSLYVASVSGGAPARALTSDGDPEKVSRCDWVSGTRLLCNLWMLIDSGSDILGYTRLFAVDENGSNPKIVSNRMTARTFGYAQNGGSVVDLLNGDDGAVLVTRNYVPEIDIGTKLANAKDGLAVDRIDTRALTTRHVETPNRTAVEYVSDGRGRVRIMGTMTKANSAGNAGDIVHYVYRPKGSDGWKDLGDYNIMSRRGFTPVAVDPDLDVAYGFDDKDGRKAAVSIALDGTGTETVVLDSPQVDVDGFVRIGRSRRVVGASFATEKRAAVYFDPSLKVLHKSLAKALPNSPSIDFIDSSADERKLLVRAGSDIDPGHYYVFDRDKKSLSEILLARPQLEGRTLATMKPVSYKASDGTTIPAYLSVPQGSEGKRVPAIVMPHGGPGARDEWGFDWLVQFFVARGFAVLQPNFRGSAGYGEAWFEKNGFQSWRTAIGDVSDGGRWLVSEGVADPAKLAIVGWSYGGYAALQSAVLDPALFKAIVAVAPVTDLETLRAESEDFSNHAIVDAFIGHGGHVREGSPAQNAGRIAAPVLMFHGDRDQNVGIGESRMMASRLKGAGKKAELVEFHDLDHYLDDSEVRAGMLDKMDAFLRSAMGMSPPPG